MRPEARDAGYLWDVVKYSEEICNSLAGMTFQEYVAYEERRLATERRLEIIGEAARRMSEGFREALPEPILPPTAEELE